MAKERDEWDLKDPRDERIAQNHSKPRNPYSSQVSDYLNLTKTGSPLSFLLLSPLLLGAAIFSFGFLRFLYIALSFGPTGAGN